MSIYFLPQKPVFLLNELNKIKFCSFYLKYYIFSEIFQIVLIILISQTISQKQNVISYEKKMQPAPFQAQPAQLPLSASPSFHQKEKNFVSFSACGRPFPTRFCWAWGSSGTIPLLPVFPASHRYSSICGHLRNNSCCRPS